MKTLKFFLLISCLCLNSCGGKIAKTKKLFSEIIPKTTKNTANTPINSLSKILTKEEKVRQAQAKSILNSTSVELNILDSSGKPVSKITNADKNILFERAGNEIKFEVLDIVDKAIKGLNKKDFTSKEQLEKEVIYALKKNIENRSFYRFSDAGKKLECAVPVEKSKTVIVSMDLVKSIAGGFVLIEGHYVIREKLQDNKTDEAEAGD